MSYEATLEYARRRDAADPLARFRDEFHFPGDVIYLTGNSLGLQPKRTRAFVQEVLDEWASLGVEGHFKARYPWYAYHEFLTEPVARLAGALPSEVVVMNGLTVNLHLMLASFYRPTAERHRILILRDAFPSDRYAVQSQLRFHGYDPGEALLELGPRPGEETLREEDILGTLDREGDRIALVLLENVNFLTGQAFDIRAITAAAHRKGCVMGWDLAHGMGNLRLRLHDDGPDFAVWCSYKYLNGGPGAVAGLFVHERHGRAFDLPRFAGWWGHDKGKRFEFARQFSPMAGAEGWQISNAPVLPMAALRASLDIFDRAGIDALCAKREALTGYLAFLLKALPADYCRMVTPDRNEARGCHISFRLKGSDPSWVPWLAGEGAIVDLRHDLFRAAPAPLYTRFEDVYRFFEILRKRC